MRPFIILLAALLAGCISSDRSNLKGSDNLINNTPDLSLVEADRLAALPLNCLQKEYPNKLNQTLGSEDEFGTPSVLHPAFYGCFDWHSSVHGHWMLVKLIKQFPELEEAEKIREILQENLSAENILQEVDYFNRDSEKGYERTYGWAWLLKLSTELGRWDDSLGFELHKNLEPLTMLVVQKFMDYLPRLLYPVRSGEHTNTAFALSMAFDYAQSAGDTLFVNLLKERSLNYYIGDKSCPFTWEPGGSDFLSPCLEEADLMRKVIPGDEFITWLREFYPQLLSPGFDLDVAMVSDRTDGKLVHLDGLNFSRAWCLYGLAGQFAELEHLGLVADKHIRYSLPGLSDGSYEGEHWLASFAVYALLSGERSLMNK